MDEKKQNSYDMSAIVANIEKVKQMKAAKQKKATVSIKPLKFEVSPEDSPIKTEIINRINARNYTYDDLYTYCTGVVGGDSKKGQELGYNTIYGLRKRHTMIDTTFSMLCDFLKLDIMLVERNEENDDNEEE